MESAFSHHHRLTCHLWWILVVLDFRTKQHQKHPMIKWFTFPNAKMINVLFRIYGSINNTTCIRRIRKTRNLTNNLFCTMDVQNVLVNQSNIAHKDVFSRIGLNFISLNVQDNNRKHVILYCFQKFKELRLLHLL